MHQERPEQAAAQPSTAIAGGPDTTAAHAAEVQDVLAALASDAAAGLTDAEARARLERFGRNELAVEPPTPPSRSAAVRPDHL